MFHQFLLLVLFGSIQIYFVKLDEGEKCQKTLVKKTPCVNIKRDIKITNYLRVNGVCTPFPSTTSVYCEERKKDFCKCSAVGDPHYRTYDGQVIHFYGDCRYTLTKYKDYKGPCSFDIEVQNQPRGDNKHFTHTESVTIKMFGDVYELRQRKTLKVNRVLTSLPFERNINVKIFQSHQFVQFVAPRCSVRVAFDGDANAFVEVSNQYSGKMNGICGDCNSKQDDFRTKSGLDVSHEENKFVLIGDSYNVSNPDQICKPAQHVTYEDICSLTGTEKAMAHTFCGSLLDTNNPFKKCEDNGHISLKDFYEDCLRDICVHKNNPIKSKEVLCKILSGLSEVCSEVGFSGIRWRSRYQCLMKCGANQHFTEKANPCPRTCENHFFGTKIPCYDLPEREGCECDKGYILDGSLCVKPMHCKCINLCVDKKSSGNCLIWKERGHCRTFAEPMNMLCPKTCGFCKSKSNTCEDEIAPEKCLQFRKQGLCFHEFYKSICGLTCNFEKCKCGDDFSVTEKCNEQKKIQRTIHHKFVRDTKGRCSKVVSETRKICNCFKTFIDSGPCNYCTGKSNVTQSIEEIVDNKCVTRQMTKYEDCGRCFRNERRETECVADKLLKTTIFFNRINACYQCISDRQIKVTHIKCKDSTKERKDKCLLHIEKTTRKPINCQCDATTVKISELICCEPQPVKIISFCRNKKIIRQKKIFILIKKECIPNFKETIEVPICRRPKPLIKGQCEHYRNGIFFGKAIDIEEIVEINDNCKCVFRIEKHERICRCRDAESYTTCDGILGVLTTTNIRYHLMRQRNIFECMKLEIKSSKFINFRTTHKIIKGKCDRNGFRDVTITKTYRVGCEIKSVNISSEPEICACIPKTRVDKKCDNNNFLITLKVERVVRNAKCVDIITTSKQQKIVCPTPTESESNCVYNKKNVTIVSYEPNNCKCKNIISRKTLSCPCPSVINVRYLDCNKHTCIGRKITYLRNKECVNQQRICPYTCCCRLPNTTSYQCDSSTGRITKTVHKRLFNEKEERCVPKTFVSSNIPVCNAVKTVEEKCDKERENYRKVIIIKKTLFEQTCSCKSVTNVIWKCCKLPKQSVIKNCNGEYLITETTSYHFDNERIHCVAKKSFQYDQIKCPTIHNYETKDLSACKYKRYEIYYKIENCKCVKYKKFEIFYKCAPPPIFNQTCHRDLQIFIKTTFYVSEDKRRILKYEERSTKKITCPSNEKVTKTECVNYNYNIIKQHFAVENCVCRYIKTTTIKKVCCSKPASVKVVCVGKHLRTITTIETMVNDEKCVRSESYKDNEIKCGKPYSIVCPCDPETNLGRLQRFYQTVENCKCVSHKTDACLPCSSNKRNFDVRRNRNCRPNGNTTVEVYGFAFQNGKCIWKFSSTYEDICRCPKDTSKTRCFDHSILRTTTSRFELKLIDGLYPTNRCIRSEIVKDKLLECPTDYTYKQCRNFEESMVQCKYQRVNCKCELNCKIVSKEPCECQKKDYIKEKCIKNVKYLVHVRHQSNGKRCIQLRSKNPILEKCPSNRNSECKSTTFRMNYGIYQWCTYFNWQYNNCRCTETSDVRHILVRCIPPIFKIHCNNNQKIYTTTTFYKSFNTCHLKTRHDVLKINCPRHKIFSRETSEYTEYKLTYFVIENCVCRERTIIRTIPKCGYTKFNKQCVENKLVFTQTDFKPVFYQKKLFPEVDSSLLIQSCQTVKTVNVKFVSCVKKNFRIEECDTDKDRLRIEQHDFTVENCECNEKVSIKRVTPCVTCRKSNFSLTPCLPNDNSAIRYQYRTTTTWFKTRKNTCDSRTNKVLEICRCPDPQYIKECKEGNRIYKKIEYKMHNQCKQSVGHQRIEPVFCYNNGRPNKWIIKRVEKCRYPGHSTINYLERFIFDPNHCICRKETRAKEVDVCCKPCRSFTECRSNQIVDVRICEHSRNMKCVTIRKEVVNSINCPRPNTVVIGDCKGRFIVNRLTKFENVNCQCKKKVHEYSEEKKQGSTKCVNNLWEETRIDYEMINKRCVQKPPTKHFRNIVCNQKLRIQDKKINKCDFIRFYYQKEIVNCRCEEVLAKKEVLHYKCCQKKVTKKSCVNHKYKVITTFSHTLMNFKCYPKTEESKTSINCQHIKLFDQIKTGKCSFKIVRYKISYKNCKCQREFVSEKTNLKNCCNESYTVHKCDSVNGRQVTVHISFKLEGYECFEVKKYLIHPINCASNCEKTLSSCVDNTQTIKLFCYSRKGCSCIRQKTKEYNVCCGPQEKSIWNRASLCGEFKMFERRIQYLTLKLNTKTNTCQPKVIQEHNEICDCPKSTNHKSCINHYKIKEIIKSYKFNTLKKSCELKTKETLSLIENCPEKTRTVVKEEFANPPGWCDRTYLITYPQNCKCKKITEKKRIICNCPIAYPPYIKEICNNNNIIVTERYKPKCSLTSVAWIKTATYKPILDCDKTIVEVGECFPSINRFVVKRRYETTIRYSVTNCKCKRNIIKRVMKDCACTSKQEIQQCILNKKVTTTFSYFIQRDFCQQKVQQTEMSVPCPKEPKITKSKCQNNKYILTKKIFLIKNCQCYSKEFYKECDCKCPQDSKVNKCSGNYLINEITTKYSWDGCKCLMKQSIISFPPKCPEFIRTTFGPCQQKDKYWYRKITTRKTDKDYLSCSCRIKVIVTWEICDCKLPSVKREKCIDNKKVFETWRWTINKPENNCKLTYKDATILDVICPAPVIIKTCNFTTEVGREVTIFYQLRACQCFKLVTVKKFHCPCNRKSKLVETGKCIPYPKGKRIDIYQHMDVRGNKCVPVKENKIEICDCAPPTNIKFCEKNNFIIIHINYVLKNKTCEKNKKRVIKSVICSTKKETKIGNCKPEGYQEISYYENVLRNCKCIFELVKKKICRCKCPDKIIKYRCDKTNGVLVITETSYYISNCECIKKESVKTHSRKCPSQISKTFPCSKKGQEKYSLETTKTTNFILNNNCTCESIVKYADKICHCDELKVDTTICDVSQNVLIRTVSRTSLIEDKCVRIDKIKKMPIKCDENWVNKRNTSCTQDGRYGTYKMIFTKYIYDKCSCKELTKEDECDSTCTGTLSFEICRNGSIHRYSFNYKFKNCKCQKTINLDSIKTIKCPLTSKVPKKLGACRIQNDRCIQPVEYYDYFFANCKCWERPRRVNEPCSTCSCPTITSSSCDKKTNNYINKNVQCLVLSDGCIKRVTTSKTDVVPCEIGTVCKPISNCTKGLETFKCTEKYLQNCKCQTKETNIKQICECEPDTVVRVCDAVSCITTIKTTKYKLVSLKNGKRTCQEEKEIKKEKCCCPQNPPSKTECINNRLIETYRTNVFDKEKKTCFVNKQGIDRTPNCSPATETEIGNCDANSMTKKIKITTKALISCKCVVRETVQEEFCQCPKEYSEMICVKGAQVTKNYQYSLIKGKCVKTETVKENLIKCKDTVKKFIEFNKATGMDIYEIHTYKTDNCECIPSVSRIGIIVECPNNTVTEKCSPNGEFITNSTIYKINIPGNNCTTEIVIKSKKFDCMTTRKKDVSKCQHDYNNGVYDIITTHFEKRVGCECQKQTSTSYELRNCDAPLTTTSCENNKIITTTVYYEPVNKGVEKYNRICEKKEKSSVESDMKCPEEFRKEITSCSSGMKTISVTNYTLINCKCIERSFIIKTEGECVTKYCFELSSECKNVSRECDSEVQSKCPITCGICEICSTNTKDCEFNEDTKQYVKRIIN